MTGKIYVFTNIRIRVSEASKASWLHQWLSSKVSTTDIFGRKNANSICHLGEGFSVDLIQGPQVDFFQATKAVQVGDERALSVPLHSVKG